MSASATEVTDRDVEECARLGARSIEELTVHLGVGAGCGCCRDCYSKLLAELDCPQAETPA